MPRQNDATLGLVAAGHEVTAAAAAEALRAGGNAFDAVVAAGFTASVAEPCLTSPAGGGFMTARTADGTELCVDFFVTVPGLGAPALDAPQLDPVEIRFGHATQVFHGGAGSVATPGCLAGYLHIHERFGRLPLDEVVAPAVRAARDGVPLNRFGAALVALLAPLLGRTQAGHDRFLRDGQPLGEGEPFVDHDLADFLEAVGAGRRHRFTSAELGGAVTDADLDTYRVVEREPLRVTHRGAVVLLNPPPAQGGALVAHGLGELAGTSLAEIGEALRAQARFRASLGPGASRGTTHISVADANGNVVAMTTSNGSGSGEFAPGIGVQLNNMMGEEDLHPEGFGSLAPGVRIGSMMTPTLVVRLDDAPVAIGSGGSERIRSVMLQMVVDLVDLGLPLEAAVARPRLHWDGLRFQAEPGFDAAEIGSLDGEVNVWGAPDLYFGGVHGVAWPHSAVGDPRRGGVGLVVTR